MIRSRLITICFCSILVLGLAACNDDDNPICPDTTVAPEPSMVNIWPHDDGNAWVFDLTYQEFELVQGFAKGDTIIESDFPSMWTLHAYLQQVLQGPAIGVFEGMYRFALDGEVTTDSGAIAQQVVSSMYSDLVDHKSDQTLVATEAPDRLLQIIAQNRPDLKEALQPYLGSETKGLAAPIQPIFLGGYAYAFEDSGYYGYGDLDTNHSWMYLDSSLEVGTEFTMQLVPMIADDIWLYGRIWSRGDLVVNGVQYGNVVECMYSVDLGDQNLTDEYGNLIGVFRAYIYGTIHYAPEIGPIMSVERHHVASDGNIQGGEDPVLCDYVIKLVGATHAE